MQRAKPGLDEMYCWSCGSIVKQRAELCMKCGVRLSGNGVAVPAPPAVRLPVEGWGAANVAAAPRPLPARDLPYPSTLFAVLLAISGGVFGIFGAFQAEMPALLLAPFVVAPVTEELLKPAGLYIMLLKWPLALKGRAYTAMLSALAGITFGLVESTVYMTVYFPDHTQAQLIYRFTVPVLVHAVASSVFSLGINQNLLGPLTGRGGFRRSNWLFFVAAMAIHGLYNIGATVLAIIGTI